MPAPPKVRPIYRRVLLALVIAASVPLGAWAIGTLIDEAAPPLYRCGAVLRAPSSATPGSDGAADSIQSESIVAAAAEALSRQGLATLKDPMETYLLRSSVTVCGPAGPGLFKVEASGKAPAEASRLLAVVIDAYEAQYRASAAGAGQARPLVYTCPPDIAAGASYGMKMVLGVAGMALLGLLLSIPLLRGLENRRRPAHADPPRPAGGILLNAIARASSAAELPHAGGCLPEARPAG